MITLPLAVLVAVNLVPLAGVIFLGWEVVPLLLLYWTESAAVGFWNIMKLLRIGGAKGVGPGLFFSVHYGMFMFVHLAFLGAFGGMLGGGLGGPFDGPRILFAQGSDFLLASAAFFVSHGISYVVNFLGKREYEGKTVEAQMHEPYKRIVVMHLAILFGGFFIMALKAGAAVLALLVVGKIVVDVTFHRMERRATVATLVV